MLSEGKNREIRRMLARLGHKVMRLKRMALGRVRLGRLASGKARPLGYAELELLRRAADRIRPDTVPVGGDTPHRAGAGCDRRRGKTPSSATAGKRVTE